MAIGIGSSWSDDDDYLLGNWDDKPIGIGRSWGLDDVPRPGSDKSPYKDDGDPKMFRDD